jgi:hypothetical protein
MPTVAPETSIEPILAVAEDALELVVTSIVPLPDPPAGETVIHWLLLAAVHEQLEPFVVTAMVPVPPTAANGLPKVKLFRLTVQARPASVIWKA